MTNVTRTIAFTAFGLSVIYVFLVVYAKLYTTLFYFHPRDLITLFWITEKNDSDLIVMVGGVVFVIFAAVIFFLIAMEKKVNLHGDARWATKAEINKQGLFSNQGVILGKKNGSYIKSHAQTGILLCMPPGGNKSWGYIFTTLLSYDKSVINTDPKFECFEKTSGFRAKSGHSVYRFSPFEKESHCYNVFDDVDKSPEMVDLSFRNIALVLIGDDSVSNNATAIHFNTQAQNLFVGIARFLFDNDKPLSLPAIYDFITESPNMTKTMTNLMNAGRYRFSKSSRAAFNTHIARDDSTEATGIISTLTRDLYIFGNATVAAATSSSDFSFRDFKKKKQTLYICYRKADSKSIAPLMSVVIDMAINTNTHHTPTIDEPEQLLLALDELIQLKNLKELASGIAIYRGYNVRFMGAIQGMAQLDSRLSKEGKREFLQGCAHQVYSFQNDIEDAEYVSRILHKKPHMQKNKSKSKGGTSQTITELGRPLMLSQEIQQLPRENAILYVESGRPVLVDQIRCDENGEFTDENFKSRVLPPIDVPKLKFTSTKSFIPEPIAVDTSTGEISDEEIDKLIKQEANRL